ncbi:MAG: DNA gyrase inhibitor YacG [Myxococcota bacterium]
MKCSVCSEELPPRSDNRYHPFCSKRCKLVDLGRWLGGDYVIAGRSRGPDGPMGDFETLLDEGHDRRDDDR